MSDSAYHTVCFGIFIHAIVSDVGRGCVRSRSGGVVVAELMGLPPLTMLSAGHNQAVMSDGERVWTMGSWMSKDGRRVRLRFFQAMMCVKFTFMWTLACGTLCV